MKTSETPIRIWIDISNSPHVLMFDDMIRELKENGCKVIITSRPLANTIQLLDQKGLEHAVIGEHYGKNILRKIFGYPIRCFQLYRFLKNKHIDAAIAQSSFHSPLVSKMLGIPCIYTNDNEHAIGNLAGMLLATRLYFPESMNRSSFMFRLPRVKKKIKIYPGVKESIYLWRKMDRTNVSKQSTKKAPFNIYIRPEPRTAQYYKGGENFLDKTIETFKNNNNVVVLARDKEQLAHYHEDKFKGIDVPAKPIPIEQIVKDCDLFIGAGGSMTRELAIMGVPTISVYQDELLGVDEYLINKGYMAHAKRLEKAEPAQLISLLEENNGNGHLLEKGKEAYYMIFNDLYAMAQEQNNKNK